jgi:purine-nucleoside phosphorylase
LARGLFRGSLPQKGGDPSTRGVLRKGSRTARVAAATPGRLHFLFADFSGQGYRREMSVHHRLEEAAAFVRERIPASPTVGVVLGSGLGAWADSLSALTKIPYAEIPNMASSAVVGHAGNLCIGTSGRVNVACLQGRVHMYEGHESDRVVFGVRLLALLGCKGVVLTNAAGGIDPSFSPGDLMLITDHLNLMGTNPLVGANDDRLGTRFPDMTEAYDVEFRRLAQEAADDLKIPLQRGVYAAMLGPSYETPAEIAMLRTLGAHAVGMSTVPEVLALRHMGVRAAAISCITNLAAGLSPTKLDHREVEATAKRTRARFVALTSTWVGHIGLALERSG